MACKMCKNRGTRCQGRICMLSQLQTLFIIITIFSKAGSREIGKEKLNSDVQSQGRLTVDVLSYILSTRNGEDVNAPKTISPCASAILTCCNEKVMNPYCSERLKCGAFFFDDNPCEDKFVIDALKAARAFYEQLNSV
ncbi:hypothetical protein RR46_01680 [Papilio xuthus]|uniref:Uncharacterized protein n=1 Tax=Papilio xuthus TaxID=66420 RepID=A0A0N0PAC7_PAPXU|nr:hypothetical protein RR46_01680 [Papilio xuthus]